MSDGNEKEGKKITKVSGKASGTSSSERLPSLKPKRDLTLGGVKKKVFVPTVPTVRRKKPTEDVPKKPANNPIERPAKSGRGGRGREEKGTRRKRELITASSVFSMGPAERMMQSRKDMTTVGHVSSSPSTKAPKSEGGPKNESKTNFDIDSEEPMEIQPAADADHLFLDSPIPPIKLPLDDTHKRTHHATKAVPKLKVKSEPMEVDNVNPVEEVKPTSNTAQTSFTTTNQIEVAQLFTPSEDEKGVFLLLQFPDCLPIKINKNDKEPKEEVSSNEKEASKDQVTSDINPSLRDIPEGVVGRIRVHKSGNVKLILGDIVFDVAMGTRGGFLQELSSVRIMSSEGADSSPASIIALGQLSHRVVCVPDLLSIIQEGR